MKKFKQTILIISVLIISVNLIKCSSPKKNHASQQQTNLEPTSYVAKLVEYPNPNSMLIESEGKGATVKSAIKDAKKTALWFALYDNEHGILSTEKSKNLFNPHKDRYYSSVNNFVQGASNPLSKKQIGDELIISLRISINSAELKQRLAKNGVIQNMDVLNATLNYPSIVVLGDENNTAAKSRVVEFLIQNNFEATEKSALDRVNSLVKQTSELTGNIDPFYNLALDSGADIYVEVESDVADTNNISQQGSVSVNAYDTASGKLLASATGYSANRSNSNRIALIQEAANEASSKLISQLVNAWRKQIESGKFFKVVVSMDYDASVEQDEGFYSALTSLNLISIKRLKGGKSTATYLVRTKQYNKSMDLYLAIKGNYLAKGSIQRQLDVGNLLLVRIGDAEGEIIIE